jgi:polyphosphate kinase
MKKLYVNREISWLSFNNRVLQEAQDHTVPLIQRMRFLGICANNLDEFYKVRVATLKRMLELENGSEETGENSPRCILDKIHEIVQNQLVKFDNAYQEILKELSNHRIYIISEAELSRKQGRYVRKFFQSKVFPAIVPVILSKRNKFPDLEEQSIYLAIKMSVKSKSRTARYALVEVPTDQISRFLILPNYKKNKYIILLEDVIRYCLKDIFSTLQYDTFEAHIIKIIRDAELDIDNDLSKSMIEKVTKGIIQREKGQAVRFVFDSSIPEDILKFLLKSMKLDSKDYQMPGGRYHNFKDFMEFPDIAAKRLDYKPDEPLIHARLKPLHSVMEAVKKNDLLLHYPYHRFSHFIDLLREAAIDPKVRSIKITAYRLARDSKVINVLINAVKNNKDVMVIIELRARFDEKANIAWSKKLQDAGVKVGFGVPDLKVHCKLLLITRKEKGKNVHYAAIGTGNFHEGTAKVYSDLILLTTDSRITNEVNKVFQTLSDIKIQNTYKHLLVSPFFMRKELISLIKNETKNAQLGKPAEIIIKVNSLVDKSLIKKLYAAGKAGVKIKLITRGICSLVPGIKGLSENITAISIIDKYLEHSRIFVFHNKGVEIIHISSADWMSRNLDSRLEVSCPVYSPKLKKEIRDMLDIQLKDNKKARIINLEQDNQYVARGNKPEVRAQVDIYRYYEKMLD